MAEMGMDVDAVESAGRQLKQNAATVGSLVGNIDKTVGSMLPLWDGPDARRFVQQSWPILRKSLVAAQTNVDGLGQSALNNASEQRQTSSANGSSVLAGSLATARQGSSNVTDAAVSTNSNGTIAYVIEHPDSRTTVTDEAQSGVHGTADGKIGPDRDGNISADGSLRGEAGIRASETNTHDLGAGTVFSDTYGSFTGAEGGLNGSATAGINGLNTNAGFDAFAGSEADIKAQVGGDYGGLGIGAGLMAGIGVKGNAHADFGWDSISLGFQIGASLGVGVQVQPSVSFSPKSIVDHLFGVNW